VVYNDAEKVEYESTSDLVFSPDSKSLAYVAVFKDNVSFVVQNAKEGNAYEWVSAPVFSTDSQSIAYVARKENKNTVVINGHEGKLYDKVLTAGDKYLNINSRNNLYYVALEQNKLYFVEKTMLGKSD